MRRLHALCLILVFGLLAGCSTTQTSNSESEADSEPADYSQSGSASPSQRSSRKEGSRSRERSKAPPSYSRISSAKQSGGDDEMQGAVSNYLSQVANDLPALNALAMHHLKKGRIGLAKTILQRAYTGHERSAALQNNLGLIYLAENDQQSAILSFKEALKFDSRLASASANLGSIYTKYGDYDRALPLLENAYRANSSDLTTTVNLATCLSVKGKSSRAVELFEKALAQEPRNIVALYNYAIHLIEYENKIQEGKSILGRLKFVGPTSDMTEKVGQLERKLADSGKQ